MVDVAYIGGAGEAREERLEILALQKLLNRRGFDTGGIDGKHGVRSRAAVKAAQIKFGLPADSYPSQALIRKLR